MAKRGRDSCPVLASSYEELQAADPDLHRTAAWMRVEGAGRVAPLERARVRLEDAASEASPRRQQQQQHVGRRQRLGQQQQQQQQQQQHGQGSQAWPYFDDPRGGQPSSITRAPWSGVWLRLHRVPAPRQHRFLAWQVLHATLMCGLRYASQLTRWQDVTQHAFCHQPGCAAAGEHDSISHIFLECPVAQRVTAWLCRLWSAVTGSQPPPRTVAVMLLGDRAQWDPGGSALQDLWDIMRLATLFYLWDVRSVGRQRSRPASALSVTARIVAHLRARIWDDSVRAFPPTPDTAAPRGARPRLTTDAFTDRWCHRGVLCCVPPAGSPVVLLRLTYPVPPPTS